MSVQKDDCAFWQVEKICGLVFMKLQEDKCCQFVLLINAESLSAIHRQILSNELNFSERRKIVLHVQFIIKFKKLCNSFTFVTLQTYTNRATDVKLWSYYLGIILQICIDNKLPPMT